MTPRLLSLSALALVLALTGCRDTLVDSNVAPDPVPTANETPSPYFKGPGEMSLGSTHGFRVEAVDGAAEYRWFFDSTESGLLAGTISEDSGGLNRLLQATAAETGVVNIAVSVFDAQGVLIAGTSKRVAITIE